MNSTILGYIIFAIAIYVVTIIGGNVQTVEHLQHQYVPAVVKNYLHIPGLVFITLAVIASVLISYTFTEIYHAFRSLYLVYFKSKIDYTSYLEAIKNIAQYSNNNDVESLEEYANTIQYPFMREGLLLVVNGYKREDIRTILEERVQNESYRHQIDDEVFRAAARSSPGYGMIGTTVGLIQMFSTKVDASLGFQPILAALATAFTCTLYGLVLANFIFQPFADKIERRTEDETLLKGMIVEGLCLIAEKRHPIFIQDTLQSFLPHNRILSVKKNPELVAR